MENLMALMKNGLPLVALVVAGGYGLRKCVYSVDGGHRAIKFSRIHGMMPRVYREGWHLMIPYFERPIIYDARTHPKVINSKTGSKDMQTVDITVRVLYRPMVEKLTELYRLAGGDNDYNERVLPSIVNEVVKTVVVIPLPSASLGTIQRHPAAEPARAGELLDKEVVGGQGEGLLYSDGRRVNSKPQGQALGAPHVLGGVQRGRGSQAGRPARRRTCQVPRRAGHPGQEKHHRPRPG